VIKWVRAPRNKFSIYNLSIFFYWDSIMILGIPFQEFINNVFIIAIFILQPKIKQRNISYTATFFAFQNQTVNII